MTSTPPDTQLDLSGFLAAHRAMRTEYGRLAAVAANPRDKAHAALIDDQIAVYLDLLHQHHAGEDEQAWPRLRERAPAAVADLDLLEAQHAQIDPLIDTAADRTLPRQQGATALAELHTAINTHLDDEERIALPLFKAHITVQEWDAFGQQAVDKMSTKQRKIVFGAGALDAPPEELAQLMMTLPGPVRLLLRWIWMPAARRRRHRLYGDNATSWSGAARTT